MKSADNSFDKHRNTALTSFARAAGYPTESGQSHNAYCPLPQRGDELLINLPRRLAALQEALAERDAQLFCMENLAKRVQEMLVKMRPNPHKALADKLGCPALRGLATAPLPFPSRALALFAKSAEKSNQEWKE